MTSGEPATTARCAECATPLATDQTYCVHCGARRGPLPARIAVALADIEDHGRPIGPEDPPLDDQSQPEDEPENIVSAARTGVIALLVMLAFGVVVGGAFSSGGLGALANTIVVAVRPGVQQAAQVVTSVAPESGGGGDQGPPQHFGGGGGGSGGGGGGGAVTTVPTSLAQAPVTVTVSQSASTSPGSATTPQAQLPSIDHVWLIVLGQQGYQQAWGTSAGHPYLRTLRRQGELVVNYDAVASSPLANEVALISGQGPTQQTVANCPTYTYVDPGGTGKQQQVLGDGCIYPQTTESLPQQFVADGLTWKAYVEGIGEDACAQSGSATSSSSTTTSSSSSTTTPVGSTTPSPTTPGSCSAASASPSTTASTTTSPSTTSSASPAPSAVPTPTSAGTTSATTTSPTSTDPVDTIGAATCPHPALGSPSLNQNVTADSTYVNWRNPVIYFQGLLLPSGLCQTNDVGIGQLATDLKNPGATPTFSYVSPDPCDDGSDTPCRPGAKAGLAQADTFLQRVVPKIERSAAYKQGGLILVTFASAPQSGPHWDTSSCCGQPIYPNLPDTSTISTGSTPGTSTSPAATTPVVTATETVTTTSPSGAPTDTATTTGASADCPATSGSGWSSSTSPSATTTPAAPTASASTTTSTTTTPGECAPVIVGTPPGGGQVGLLMISPWIDPNKTDVVDTLNHFSVLKGIEQLFKLPNLGYAKVGSLQGFGLGMFASSKH